MGGVSDYGLQTQLHLRTCVFLSWSNKIAEYFLVHIAVKGCFVCDLNPECGDILHNAVLKMFANRSIRAP
jgi:hypothetical protein